MLWIDAHAHPDLSLRQVDVPGVDTKFIERNRTIVSALLDQHLPEYRVDHTKPPSDFAGRYLFRSNPPTFGSATFLETLASVNWPSGRPNSPTFH